APTQSRVRRTCFSISSGKDGLESATGTIVFTTCGMGCAASGRYASPLYVCGLEVPFDECDRLAEAPRWSPDGPMPLLLCPASAAVGSCLRVVPEESDASRSALKIRASCRRSSSVILCLPAPELRVPALACP